MNDNICLINDICISRNNFFTLVIFFIGLTIFYNFIKTKLQLDKNNTTNNNIYELPLRKLLINRDRSILYDPLSAPERRVDIRQYPVMDINIPTRGYPDNYQLMGLMSRDSDEKILQLFGRATYPGSNQYEYYVTTEQYGFANKIPIKLKGGKEIYDNDIIRIDQLKGEFKVKLYEYNTPRYIPII